MIATTPRSTPSSRGSRGARVSARALPLAHRRRGGRDRCRTRPRPSSGRNARARGHRRAKAVFPSASSSGAYPRSIEIPPSLLLGQPVRVFSGQRFDERRLAVVDVSGGADDERAHDERADATAAASSLDLDVRPPCGSRAIARPSRDDSRRRVVVPARSCGPSSSSTAHAKLGSSSSGSAPPPTRATVSLDLTGDEAARGAPRARGRSRRALSSMRSTGISRRARSGSRYSARVASSAASVSLSARSARWRGCRRNRRRDPRDRRGSRPAGRRAACRRGRRRDPRPRERLARAVGSSRPRSRSALPEPRSSTSGSSCRRASCASPARSGCSVKPTRRKFDWWTRRSAAVSADSAARSRRSGCDWSCPPRRAAPPSASGRRGSGTRRRSRSARRARRRLAPVRQRGEREEHRSCVVVDDQRGLCAGQPPEDRRDVVCREPRLSPPRGRTRGSLAARRPRPPASRGRLPSGERPRFVWTMTPWR